MNAIQTLRVPSHLVVVAALANLLQRLEASPRAPDPQQYRSVVTRLAQALSEAAAGPELDALLRAFPAAAELYENLHYQHAGLCRSPLELAIDAETRARQTLDRVARAG